MAKKISKTVTTKAFENKASKLSSMSSHTYSVPSSLYSSSSTGKKESKKK